MMQLFGRLCTFAAIAIAFAAAGMSPARARDALPGPAVRVAQGLLAGRPDGAVDAFLGIPFAAPPVGPLRWRAPQPALPWTGERSATDFGAGCVQDVHPGGHAPWTQEYVVAGRISEDCLTLNVWTPARAGEKKPVLVWIHGGGFQEGSGSVPIYRGSSLAGRGIVVVTINYRLGLFGFVAHPDLRREAGAGVAANFGLQDQIAALRWVHANIAAFGGDPAHVTIAGQSAGSMSVHSLVVSPLAKGLFVRAIAQSALPTAVPLLTLAEAERSGQAFAADKGARTLAELRAMPVEQLALPRGGAMGGKYRFGVTVDGRLLPAAPAQLLAQGSFTDVPMIIGQTADEASSRPGYGAGDAAAYAAFLEQSLGDRAADVAPLYPAATDAERSQAMKAISRDTGLSLIDAWAATRLGRGRTPLWGYYFNHVEPGPASDSFGAFHSSDIPYALSTLDAAPDRAFTLDDRRLSLAMSSYWVNFVRSGDPNGAGLPPWLAIDPADPHIIELSTTIHARPLLSADKRRAYRPLQPATLR